MSPRAILAALATAVALLSWSASAAAKTRVEVYSKSGCPHCAAGKQYLGELSREHDLLLLVFKPDWLLWG